MSTTGPTPTLVDDLMEAAVACELVAATSERPTTHRLCFERAARLRAAATRLSDELSRAMDGRRATADFGETEASRACDLVCRVLERINGEG